MKIQAVDGRRWSVKTMRNAIEDSEKETRPLKMLVANGGFVETYEINYHDGIRYPHLERVEGASDYLDEIIKPLAAENVTGLLPAEGWNASKRREK